MSSLYRADMARDTADLEHILALQRENLRGDIPQQEEDSQGFVTVRHSLDTLQQMHALAPSIVVRQGQTPVAYALTMLRECRALCPELVPMFQLLETLEYQGRPLTQERFYVMGQICVGKAHRGQGLFDRLYHHHRELYRPRFDLLVTEVATRNRRSLRAHERVGFQTVHTYRDALEEWAVILWDWRTPSAA
ncbi:GNAT family N-acetyltransferase [Stigmatella erecta]|uniref:Acetyltransferase (GNAT) family protein n=1 Tax=Stigmatella erecta TaxID=83460 RepID=A0A1I0KYB6_9BACT|nr:GNAT family N-acetyltransferase [Stigmatella erecta]SEU31279.1 Acetyltransferase (GNAT) family protein [Stigmatella erecta]